MTWSDEDREAFRARTTLADLPVRTSADLIGTAVDDAWLHRDVSLLRHITDVLLPTVSRTHATPAELSELDYFTANAWNGIKFLDSDDPGGGWEWESPVLEQETLCIRRATQDEGLFAQPQARQCQILTNLANCYSTTGRVIDAIWHWDQALRAVPTFGMARANRGIGLWTYATAQYDPGHQLVLAREAWRALNPEHLQGLEPGTDAEFRRVRAQIEAAVRPEAFSVDFDIDGFPLGESASEKQYRRWCLKQRAFLNPLNELGEVSVAAQDVLSCPSVVAGIGEGPRFHDYMNQINQEYCSARWLIYEATHENAPHLSDRDVRLYNTLDYPSYGLRTEQLKLAFRGLYSLFDKVAFFLNAYLGLGVPEKRVSMRGLWYIKQDRKRGIRPEFSARHNWMMRGLFWLTKDLYEDTPGFRKALDPLARQMADVRNQLEHKYLKLHGDLWAGPDSSFFTDSLAMSLPRDEFEKMTLHLLRMVRSAIIQLALSVNREEQLRAEKRGPDAITPPMFLDSWEDDWKS